jgi:phosphatidylinositol 3-kinase
MLSDEAASLLIELPTFDLPIMHEETFYQLPQQGASGQVSPIDLVTFRKNRKPVDEDELTDGPKSFKGLDLITFLDYENEDDNPYEDKYRTLAHDLLRGMVDPDLKPDKEQRSKLEKIIDAPSHHPTREERDLLWRFRFSLVDNRRALTKFLVAVDWSVESEVVQAAELLEQWRRRSPIEVTDALKLLGKHVAFQTNVVRDYAIETLSAAPDSELRLYLLQLVQALKYENSAAVENGPRLNASSPSNVSPLSSFLINRAAGSIQLANFLYW